MLSSRPEAVRAVVAAVLVLAAAVAVRAVRPVVVHLAVYTSLLVVHVPYSEI